MTLITTLHLPPFLIMRTHSITKLLKLFSSVAVLLLLNIAQVQTVFASTSVAKPSQGYMQTIDGIERQIRSLSSLAAKQPGSWVRLEQLAQVQLHRAKLTGRTEDFVQTQRTLQRAFSLAGDGAGPFLSRAEFNFAIHRFSEVEVDLKSAESALLIEAGAQSKIDSLRADVALYQSRYHRARESYEQLEQRNPSAATATRLADYHVQTGKYEQAEHWFQIAETRAVGESALFRAWIHLQYGILDLERGRLNDAKVHYEHALAIFPGYWLVQEHIAEIDALQGRTAIAEQQYRKLIDETNSPYFMVALAEVLLDRVEPVAKEEAEFWRKAAQSTIDSALAYLPEMSMGHAVEHLLQSGEPERVLPMAQQNYQSRPGSEAAMLLLQAQAVNGELAEAIQLLKQTLNTPYRSAQLFATASVLFSAVGEIQQANEYKAAALHINPNSIEAVSWLQKQLTP